MSQITKLSAHILDIGRVGGVALDTSPVRKRLRPLTIISEDFRTNQFSYTLLPRFYTRVGDFPAQHFVQHNIHRRIFNELNNCLFQKKDIKESQNSRNQGFLTIFA